MKGRNYMKVKSDFGCYRCGAVPANDVTMTGQYNTRLCQACRNDWHEYANATPERQQMHRAGADIMIAFALMQGDAVDRREEIYALQTEHEAAENRLYEIARTWITTGMPDEDPTA